MTLTVTHRADIDLAAVLRVAWQGESVTISEVALRRIADCRRSFLRLIDSDADLSIYGVTTAMGELASRRLDADERARHARIKAFAAATAFGDTLPDRVVRGIVLARLANFLEGHAATTPRIALGVAAMLDGGPMPAVPAAGQGGAGEILALYPLFAALTATLDLEVKERGSLINGSPCAAALAADAALAALRRIRLAERTFALSIEAFRAPLEHYDAALDGLWGDAHDAAALQGLRSFLGAPGGRRNYQAPVSYRIVPRVLGQAHRALATIERGRHRVAPLGLGQPGLRAAGRCLPAGPLPQHRRLSQCHGGTGARRPLGHLGGSLPALRPARVQAAERQGVASARSVHGGGGIRATATVTAASAISRWPSRAILNRPRCGAQRTFIPGTDSAGSGQDDVATTAVLAFTKEQNAGRCLDAALAMLAVIASQALFVTEREAPPALRSFLGEIRGIVPPVTGDRVLGPDLAALTGHFTRLVFDPHALVDPPAAA